MRACCIELVGAIANIMSICSDLVDIYRKYRGKKHISKKVGMSIFFDMSISAISAH